MKRAWLCAACTCALATMAHAQSNPGWSYGQVPTAGQWNAEFSSKQDYLGYPPLNASGGSMTGRLYLFPSSTTAAGLNLGQGNTPGAPINGDVWITSQGMFYEANGSTVGPIGAGSGGGGSSSFGIQVDALGVTATNTVTNLTKSWNGQYIVLIVNGVTYSNTGSLPAFSVSGAAVSWSATNSGHTLITSDLVFASYTAVAVPVVPALGAGVNAALQGATNQANGIPTLNSSGKVANSLLTSSISGEPSRAIAAEAALSASIAALTASINASYAPLAAQFGAGIP